MSCPGGKEGRSQPARKKPHVISSLEYALAIIILAACSSGQSHDAIMSGGWLGWVMGGRSRRGAGWQTSNQLNAPLQPEGRLHRSNPG